MRITAVIHSLSGGGAERVMAGLVNRLAERGHDLRLITLDAGEQDRHSIEASVSRECLNVMGESHGVRAAVRHNRRRIGRLRQAIGDSRPDVVLSFCDQTNVLTLLAAGPLAVPVVVSERSDPGQQKLGRAWSLLRRWTYRRAAALVALTPASAGTLQAWNRRPVVVIPSAVESTATDGTLPTPSGTATARTETAAPSRQRVLGVGRLSPEKGFDRLIAAFTEIASDFPDWELCIAGEGSEQERLEAMIKASDFGDRVTLAGWVRPIWPLYRGADLFVLSSRYEGFPSALLEAMAAGVAAIAVDCESGPREIIRPGIDGVLVPAEALASEMRRWMSDRAGRERLAGRAVEVVVRFGWETMVDRYEEVLLTAIAESKRGTSNAGM